MRRILNIMFLIIVLGGGALGLGAFVQYNQSIGDSGALYGGELERGYPYAGYLVSYEPSGGLKTCGYAVLNSGIAVTASHCVDNSSEIYLGLGEFSFDQRNHTEVLRATQKEAWTSSQDRTDDFAILELNKNDNFFNSFAQIASPREGCDFRVVAYGRTENPEETLEKPRKSGKMCVSDIRSKIFFIQGEQAGICFGDSGSPLFYEGTNQLVGMVASIVLEDPSNPEPCAIGNKAIVVRADANQSLINNVISEANDPTLSSINVNDGLTIEVAEQNLLEKIGLDQLANLSEQEKLQYALYGSVGLVFILIGITIFILLRPESKSQSNSQGSGDIWG